MKKAFGSALIGLLLFLCQCVKETPPEKKAPAPRTFKPSEQIRERVDTPAPFRPREQEGGVIKLTPKPSPGPSASPPRVLTTETALFAYFPQQRLMAEDFKIGALQDGIASSRDYLKAAAVIRKFFDSLTGKEVDYTLVLPAALPEVKAAISYPLSQGYIPQRYRIGKMAFEGEDELRANVRLYKDEGVTAGEVYLTKSGDEWLVSDVQAGFTLLGRKYEKPKEPFMPGSYRFLLEEK